VKRPIARAALVVLAPPLVLAVLGLLAELMALPFADRRPCFLVREGEGDAARFVLSGRAPTPATKLRDPSFSAAPAAGAVRLLCLGDSTVYGAPFEPPVPFANWLALRLPRLLPGRRFEVVNAGAPGMCSEDVVDLLRDCGGAGAAALIVYVGHNEYLDANLPRLLSPAGHALRRALGATRAGARLLEATKSEPQSLLGEKLLPRTLVHDAPMIAPEAIALGLSRYRSHLEEIVAFAQARGIAVALCRPVANAVDSPPHRSCFTATTGAPAREEFTTRLKAVRATRLACESATARGEPIDAAAVASALAELDALAEVDPGVALLPFERGRLLLLRGDIAAARDALKAALERDDYPTRQLPRAGEIVAEVARARGAWLVDAAPLFAAEVAPALPAKRRLFVDDVHPDPRGHELLAEAILRTLAEHGFLAPASDWQFAKEPSPAEYRELAGFDPAAQAGAFANEAFMLLGESRFDRGQRKALRAAEAKLRAALEFDANCAEAHLGLAILAAVKGATDRALAELERARAADASIDALLREPWENVPELRAALAAAGLALEGGRLVRDGAAARGLDDG